MNDSKIIYSTMPDMAKVPGGWEPGRIGFKLEGSKPTFNTIDMVKETMDGITVVDNFLSDLDCDRIVDFMSQAPYMEEVSVQGMMDASNKVVGSKRTTAWMPSLAEELWRLFKKYELNCKRVFDEYTPTDWWQGDVTDWWEPCAVSPMMRYMKYEKGGEHYPHYDAGYIYPDNRYRSLVSMVLYFTDNESGETRFIQDHQKWVPIQERNHNDWTRPANDSEVVQAVKPRKGRLLFFNHRLCHDVSKYLGAEGARIIIRTDLIYKAL